MLTGDHAAAADVVARAVGIKEVYADLLPEDKVRHIEKMMAEKTRGRVNWHSLVTA